MTRKPSMSIKFLGFHRLYIECKYAFNNNKNPTNINGIYTCHINYEGGQKDTLVTISQELLSIQIKLLSN